MAQGLFETKNRKDRKKGWTFDESKTEKNDGNAKHLTDQELFRLKSFVNDKRWHRDSIKMVQYVKEYFCISRLQYCFCSSPLPKGSFLCLQSWLFYDFSFSIPWIINWPNDEKGYRSQIENAFITRK